MSVVSRYSPFVLIKPGTAMPPIFFAHGLSGTVQFAELARNIKTEHPIYGIQARGIDGTQEPLDRVEDMAALYLEALKEQHPHDAYILIGYSFGGLVAFEMARRLRAAGTKIALLVLLDTFPHPRYMPFPERFQLFLKRMRVHAGNMQEQPFSQALQYFANGINRRLGLARPLNELDNAELARMSFEEQALRRVNQKAYAAYAHYKPVFYPGAIKFVTTATKTFFPGDPLTLWGKLATKVEVEVLYGDHLNIVTTEFMPLAGLLTRYVQEVSSAAQMIATRHDT